MVDNAPLVMPVWNFGKECENSPKPSVPRRTPVSHQAIHQAVQNAVSAKHGDAMVQDTFDDFAVFSKSGDHFKQGYEHDASSGEAKLVGEPQKIKKVTKYQAVKPASSGVRDEDTEGGWIGQTRNGQR